MNHSIHDILKQYWNYDSFRPLQQEIIESILSGKDTLALLPTGGGKSICFQVPALAKKGLCLVVSPLIALMKDQVENLKRKGITAFSIYSGMSRNDVVNTLKIASNSNCKFLYVSPERLETNLFKEYLSALEINLVAVDEAHCISQWGYDFRPPYLRIAALRDQLPDIPFLALTASATPAVQQDICEKLLFSNYNIFRQSFERPNLSYSVFNVDSKINKLKEILDKVPGTSIVYCRSRKHTKEIARLLQLNHISADYYHAGLTHEVRNQKQSSWIANQTRVIVCTNAFGMGIDKPDVRTVIHVGIPDNLENYYQEAGRAGRDQKKSFAVLLYYEKELEDLRNSVSIQFSPLQQIIQVYGAAMNYLQIESGSGEGNYYDFDLEDFIKKFSLDPRLAINALKILEQEELIALNEQVYLPSKVEFTANKSELYEFERSNPSLEQIVKTLLRTYEGIFDYPTPVNENFLAKLLHIPVETVHLQLHQLHHYKIIKYEPKKDKPQLYLYTNRIPTQHLTFNEAFLQKRKDEYKKRIDAMLKYVKNSDICRSQYIASYFGDTDTKLCGNCDNCLKKKNTILSKEEFQHIHKQLLETLKKPLPAKELSNTLKDVKKEKLWQVIEFLQAENKIVVDGKGLMKLKN